MVDSPDENDVTVEKERPGFLRILRNRFFTGLIIALPLAATIWVISFIVTKVDATVWNLLPKELNPGPYLEDRIGFNIPGIGLIVAISALFVLGVIASNFIGGSILRFGERILERVPFVRNLYGGLKQIVNTVAKSDERNFKEVCLLEYPRPGLWAIGFVTADLKGAPTKHLKGDYVSIFVPTTPNPTSGFLLFTKRTDLKILDMTPEEGAKMIISGGIVSNDDKLLLEDGTEIELPVQIT